jgi:hypothetical protein
LPIRLSLKVTVSADERICAEERTQRRAGCSTVLSNPRGDLVVPAIVSGTFASKFAPDAEQMAAEA